MTLPNYTTPALAAPRILYATFLTRLKSKNSPAIPQAKEIYDGFISSGVDPSFALAQYRVESQYGTAGIAATTKSWGNMLYDSSLCLNATGQYAPGNGYTYAKYNDVYHASLDYAHYLHDYADNRDLHSIYEVTAEWIGKVPGSKFHLSYVDIIINDMILYETVPGKFYEVGDKMIYGGPSFDRLTGQVVQKYPITFGMQLYRGTDGTPLKKYLGTPGNAWFLGPVQGDFAWGMVCIGTSIADPDATWCYIKNVQKDKIINVG